MKLPIEHIMTMRDCDIQAVCIASSTFAVLIISILVLVSEVRNR